jgi:formylglycine-generating enzyme required for sulfatase activity
MGDPLDGNADAPVHTVSLSGFYMEKSLVTGERWNAVYQWALLHGYSFDNPGLSKAVNHPAHTVNWYDAVKWCNARSQMEGRTPIYYTDALRRNVYKAGQTTPYLGVLDPLGQQYGGANGYRLPTEAEWEKAARGGLVGKRFPWGDTITHSQANYASSADIPYDTSPTRGYHPSYAIGDFPYTSPVASFAPNGYGLNDMAGNLEQWCWDWYGDAYYSASNGALDPLGPASGVLRVRRGFSWTSIAERLRCAKRDGNPPGGGSHFTGFRCVRGL